MEQVTDNSFYYSGSQALERVLSGLKIDYDIHTLTRQDVNALDAIKRIQQLESENAALREKIEELKQWVRSGL